MIGGSGGNWWSDLFMWVSNCKIGLLVGLIGDCWLDLLLVWASDCKIFSGFQCFGWLELLDSRWRLTENAEYNDVGWGWGWVLSCCCYVYFKFLGFFFFFFHLDLMIFLGL